MASYELTFIVRPEADETGLSAVMERIANHITSAGGQILNRKVLGRRRLAYPIRKVTEGTYVYFALELPPTSVRTIERNLTLTDAVLRSLVVRVEPDEMLGPEQPAPTAEAAPAPPTETTSPR